MPGPFGADKIDLWRSSYYSQRFARPMRCVKTRPCFLITLKGNRNWRKANAMDRAGRYVLVIRAAFDAWLCMRATGGLGGMVSAR